ncbi:alpha hydrolase [Salinirubellus salinus]|uniref:Alpha hydrolase n=1 Tax=Salinirubellus salinus TaxID=1364945 RepID=A0A9E7R7Y4_9EURY|nr:alpha hydrolase [Salinirubellus salinus]UWM56769.1 alpha hydrolase [Salinirubellus salinus]
MTDRAAPAGRAAVLFSGGKDSALAALLLEPHYDVTLVTCGFGLTDLTENAAASAAALSLPHETRRLESAVLESAVDRLCADGYPNAAVQSVHEAAVERLAGDAAAAGWDVVADGTRRDDRTPTVARPFAQSVEDRFGVAHVAPLAGFGRGAVDALVDARLEVETGPSETLAKGDYETALRAALRDRTGDEAVGEVFPAHEQSRVVGRRG